MSKFTFNFYLDIRKPLKSKLYSIKVHLYDKEFKKSLNFTIKKVKGMEISASKKDWLDIWENKDKKDSFGEVIGETTVYGRKSDIRNILKVKQNNLNEIISRKNVLTAEDVKDSFYQYVKQEIFINDVYAGFNSKIKTLVSKEQYKTASVYKNTMVSIAKHNNPHLKPDHLKDDENNLILKNLLSFRFNDINKDWLDSYDRKRRADVKVSTLAIDLRNIRTVFNRAVEIEKSLVEIYPFGKGKYQIPEADSRNASLTPEQLQKLIDFKSDNYYLQMARDYWIFSYCARGINLKDIARMKKGQTDYIRAKTEFTAKKVLRIPFKLNKEQRKIVKRYKGTGKYLFDIIDERDDKQMQQKKINNKTSSIAKQIKKIVELLNFPKDFSMVWARHTYTTLVHKSGKVDLKQLSLSLSHHKLSTTEKYIDSLKHDDKAIDDVLGIE